MKSVYHQLNQFDVDVQRNCFVGEFWVPTKFRDEVVATIHRSAVSTSCGLVLQMYTWRGPCVCAIASTLKIGSPYSITERRVPDPDSWQSACR